MTQVHREHEGDGPAFHGDAGGLVLAAVDDHEWCDLQPAGNLRHAPKHVCDVGLFLVGADQAHHRSQPEIAVALVEILAPDVDDKPLERPQASLLMVRNVCHA